MRTDSQRKQGRVDESSNVVGFTFDVVVKVRQEIFLDAQLSGQLP